MPLPLILEIPNDPRGWDSYSFAHQLDHTEIQEAVQKQKSINLPVLELYPVDPQNKEAFAIWADLHAQAHDDFNSVLGIPGNDLTNLDLKDPASVRTWLFMNFQEHQNARQVLGI